MKDFITKQQAGHIIRRARDEKQDIIRTAGKRLTGAQNKRIKELNQIISDAEAVQRGDGRKKGR